MTKIPIQEILIAKMNGDCLKYQLLRRPRQEDHEFKASLGKYKATLFQKQNTEHTRVGTYVLRGIVLS
jgi:hypothetical protein